MNRCHLRIILPVLVLATGLAAESADLWTFPVSWLKEGWSLGCALDTLPNGTLRARPDGKPGWKGFGLPILETYQPADLSPHRQDGASLEVALAGEGWDAFEVVLSDVAGQKAKAKLRGILGDPKQALARIPLTSFSGNLDWRRVKQISFEFGNDPFPGNLEWGPRFALVGDDRLPRLGTHGAIPRVAAIKAILARTGTVPAAGNGVSVVTQRDGLSVQITFAPRSHESRPAFTAVFPFTGRNELDLTRRYGTSQVRLSLKATPPGVLEVGLMDAEGQPGAGVSLEEAPRDPATGDYLVPLSRMVGNRLDRITGFFVGPRAKSMIRVEAVVTGPLTLGLEDLKDRRTTKMTGDGAVVTIRVDATTVVKDLAHFGFGAHWDYTEGGQAHALRAPVDFYRDMGFNMIRIEGTRADPDDKAAQLDEVPTHHWPFLLCLPWVSNVALLKAAGMDGVAAIVPYNEFFKAGGSTAAPTLDGWLGDAWKMVPHLKRQGFADRWYEIGNELWGMDKSQGDVFRGSPGRLARDVAAYAREIKARDPGARFTASIGRSTNSAVFREYLKTLDALDGLNFSFYHYKTSYEGRLDRLELDYLEEFISAMDRVDPAAAARMRFGATEYAAHDWDAGSKGWVQVNDLGHALIQFQKAAEGLVHPRMDYVIHWTVRWFWDQEKFGFRSTPYRWGPDNRIPASDWDLLDISNRLTAGAQAIRLLGRNRLDRVVASESSASPRVMSFAVQSKDGEALHLFILNKDFTHREIRVTLGGFKAETVTSERFTGEGLHDPWATVTPGPGIVAPVNGAYAIDTPELSVTLLRFHR